MRTPVVRAQPVGVVLRQAPRNTGFSLPGLIFLLMTLAGIAVAFSHMARQAGRSSHWFFQAQVAYDLADCGLKSVAHVLQTHSGLGNPQGDPLERPLRTLFEAVSRGTPIDKPIPFLSTSDPGGLPRTVAEQLRDFERFDPRLDVTVKITSRQPLWKGNLAGFPQDSHEARGTAQLCARATVTNATGLSVSRSISLEWLFKVVSILPPLLGRFSLFVETSAGRDANFVKIQYDPNTGDGLVSGGPMPLIVRSGLAGQAVEPKTNKLDRQSLATTFADPKFLDRQGWIYLGSSGVEGPWKLRLAHGFTGEGESPLLPGYYTHALFNGSTVDDALFRGRLQRAFGDATRCGVSFVEPLDGLYHLHHGFAMNYEQIGISRGRQFLVRRADGQRIKLEMGSGEASGLRLFGTPTAISPSLVFGPVERVTVRKSIVSCTFAGTGGSCDTPGTLVFPLFKLQDHTPSTQGPLVTAFGSPEQYEENGPKLWADTFNQSLGVVLNANGGGLFGTSGVLHRFQQSSAARVFTSDLLPWLGSLSTTDGPSVEARQKLWNGELDSPRVFRGNLDSGLRAFYDVLREKAILRVKPNAVRRRILVGSALRIPGVVVVDQVEPLVISAVDRVEAGGILVSRGPIQITGNIMRGPAREPLTLVSGAGDIVLSPGVQIVEAYLVALNGKVRFAGNPVTIVGGVAGHELDLDGIKTQPASRTIRFAEDMDPTGPALESSYRVYFGGEERLAVFGGEG